MIIIPLTEILPPSRTDIDCRDVQESIAKIGQIDPIVVKRQYNGYKVIDGNKRVAALKALGKLSVIATYGVSN